MTPPPFDVAAAERRLGPAAVEAIERLVEAAPLLSAEQRERLRVLFAPGLPPEAAGQRDDHAA